MKRFVTFSINKVVGIIENTPHFERQKYVVECDDLTQTVRADGGFGSTGSK